MSDLVDSIKKQVVQTMKLPARLEKIDQRIRIEMDILVKKAHMLAVLQKLPPEEWKKEHWDTLNRLEKEP